jgi:hypothetical protein
MESICGGISRNKLLHLQIIAQDKQNKLLLQQVRKENSE